MKIYWLIITTIFLFNFNSFGKSKVFKKIDSNKICHNATNFKNIQKACSARSFPKGEIYECYDRCLEKKGRKCKKYEWKLMKAAYCNSDGKEKGYYLGYCGGSPVAAKSLRKSCAYQIAKGKTVVYCKRGKEIKRINCPSASSNQSTKKETKVFIEKCGGKIATNKNRKPITRNIGKACKTKKYKNKTLIQCKNKCVRRSGSKCKKYNWMEVKKFVCGKNNKKINLKGCNEQERKIISESYKIGTKNLRVVRNQISKFLKNPSKYFKSKNLTLSKTQKKDVIRKSKVALKKIKGIFKIVNKKRSNFICPGMDGSCGGGTQAYERLFKINDSSFCPTFFTNYTRKQQAGILIHEYSHNVKTKDLTYTKEKIKDVDWGINASTYNNWIERGEFCLPGFDKKCF